MNYSDFDLKTNTDTIRASIQPGVEINILRYLPIEEKNDIIQGALQNADENGIYNLVKLDMYFKLYCVYSYTDIEFTTEEKNDPAKLYNELCSNGIMECIFNSMDRDELNYLENMLEKTFKMKVKYRNTAASVINSFMESMPINANAAKEIIEKFNPEDFQRVIDFATAANGNRPIN